MKPILFKVIVNNDRVICDNVKDIRIIDGVEYLVVHKQDNPRSFMMRRDALEKLGNVVPGRISESLRV